MKQENSYTTSITVDKSPMEVYNAINDVRGWWQGEIIGDSEKLQDEFTYQMADFHFTRQRVIELIPGKKIVWLVTESQINFVEDKKEWLNTKIIFEISELKGKTKISFVHEGLTPAIACYGDCSGGWKQLIEKSLYSLITTGKGVDVF